MNTTVGMNTAVGTTRNTIFRVNLRNLPESHFVCFIFGKLTCQKRIETSTIIVEAHVIVEQQKRVRFN